jgi:acetate kinase
MGERSPDLRAAAAARLEHLGVALDDRLEKGDSTDSDITASGAAARTVVVTAREDLEVAREVRRVLG